MTSTSLSLAKNGMEKGEEKELHIPICSNAILWFSSRLHDHVWAAFECLTLPPHL